MLEAVPFLKLAGVSKWLGNVEALRNVSCALSGGEVVGLVGPNGAGKSTLLKCLAGHFSPDTGRIFLEGLPYAPTNPAEGRRAGTWLVEQELSIFPSLSVEANWRLQTGRSDSPPDEAAANPRLLAGQLEPAGAQRLLLAAAIDSRPRVLLLDEPTALLDGGSAEKFMRAVFESRSPEKIVIVATHRWSDLLHADRWLFLREGQLVLDTGDREKAEQTFFSGGERATDRSSETTAATGFIASTAAVLFGFARKALSGLRRDGSRVAYLGPERQADHVLPHLSVNQHCSLMLSSGDWGAFGDAMNLLGLPWTDTLGRRNVMTLSGGMQQKLFLAAICTATADARVICDPLRGLDPLGALAAVELLRATSMRTDYLAIFSEDHDLLLASCQTVSVLGPRGTMRSARAGEVRSGRELLDVHED